MDHRCRPPVWCLERSAGLRWRWHWQLTCGCAIGSPLYTASKKGLSSIIWPNTMGRLRAFVEDLFHEYNVDLYLCGHVHAVRSRRGRSPRCIVAPASRRVVVHQYERHYPIYRGEYVKVGRRADVGGCAWVVTNWSRCRATTTRLA